MHLVNDRFVAKSCVYEDIYNENKHWMGLTAEIRWQGNIEFWGWKQDYKSLIRDYKSVGKLFYAVKFFWRQKRMKEILRGNKQAQHNYW